MVGEQTIWSDDMVRVSGVGPAHPNHPDHAKYWDADGEATLVYQQFVDTLTQDLAQKAVARATTEAALVPESTKPVRSVA